MVKHSCMHCRWRLAGWRPPELVDADVVASSDPLWSDSSVFEEFPFELPSKSISIGGEPQPIISRELAMRGPEMPGTVQFNPTAGGAADTMSL